MKVNKGGVHKPYLALVAAIFVFVLVPGTSAAQTVADTSTAIVATGESSKIVSHTTSGTNRLMIVGVSINNNTSAEAFTPVT